MAPRITFSVQPDGAFELAVNEAGRDLLVKELQALGQGSDHFHLEAPSDADIPPEVPLCAVPYRDGDRVLLNGKVLFRPDEWDAEFFPHVLVRSGEPTG